MPILVNQYTINTRIQNWNNHIRPIKNQEVAIFSICRYNQPKWIVRHFTTL